MDSQSDREPLTILVVGNGMVSHCLCSKLVGSASMDAVENASDGTTGNATDSVSAPRFKIIVVGEERRPAYDRVHLTRYFENRSVDDLLLSDRQWYETRGIELKLGQRVTSVDSDAQTVTTSLGKTISYDRLVLATGSRPFVPPIEGVDNTGVFVYRSIDDVVEIDNFSRNVTSAAVLGGGLLGLEAAKALHDLGVKTHVVEMAPTLMPRQLDSEGAKVLQTEIEKLGIEVHLIKRTERITGGGQQQMLHFDNSDPLTVGMVVISAGIRPNDSLAESCDIETGSRGGFRVDDQLQTSVPKIYAIGECASHNDTIYGLVAPGYQMADVLAENLMAEIQAQRRRKKISAGKARFVSGDRSARLKLLGVDVATLGQPLGEVPNATTISSKTEDTYRKLILSKGRVVGIMAVGEWPEIERVRQAIAAKNRIWKWRLNRFALTGDLWKPSAKAHPAQWPESAIVCSCLRISRGTLTSAQQAGCCTVAALAESTGASTVCGSCKPLLADLVDEPTEPAARPSKGLLVVSFIAIILLTAWLIGPLPYAQTVLELWHRIDFIWRDSFWKQVTGYALLGISGLALLLPFRKRWKRFAYGNYGLWRTAHGVIGILTLVGLLVHTGMRMGSNFNLLLAVTFLSLNFSGAITGAITSWESRTGGELGMTLRQWKPRLSRVHIYCLWPMPVLLIIHIACVYFY